MISTINVNGHRMLWAPKKENKPQKLFGYSISELDKVDRDRILDGSAADEKKGQLIERHGSLPVLRSITELPDHVYLWWSFRSMLGFDLTNIAQLIGDCVSWGARNATAYRAMYEIATLYEAERFYDLFPPWNYGGGRYDIGKGRINGDGSIGEWSARFSEEFGWIHAEMDNVPRYSASVAKKWGRQPPKEFYPIAKPFPCITVPVTDAEAAMAHIARGEPVSIASSQGFAMKPGSDMYHRARGTWHHQMCLTGYCLAKGHECFAIRNSWGDAHGQVIDPYTGESWPKGYIRSRVEVVDRMLRQGDSFAWTTMHGFSDDEPFPVSLFSEIEQTGIQLATAGPFDLTL